MRALIQRVLARVPRRERGEVLVLVGALGVLLLIIVFVRLASAVMSGETQTFDEQVLRALRSADDPARPAGPPWLRQGAVDITALGSPTILGLTVLAVTGYLVLHGLYRNGLFVFVASAGGWMLNWTLKAIFERARPSAVPHWAEVASSSFPSGHALTSAAVALTLGTMLMRLAKGRVAKFYCIFIAMLVTFLVGTSRVFLGVHHPTDVMAGWIIGISWALLCWVVEKSLERRAGLKQEQQEAEQKS